jgi:thioredoxin 1
MPRAIRNDEVIAESEDTYFPLDSVKRQPGTARSRFAPPTRFAPRRLLARRQDRGRRGRRGAACLSLESLADPRASDAVNVSAIDVTTATFETEVLASARPVVVDFWAAWCGPCRAVAPILDQLAQERAGGLKVAKVDIDAEPALAQRYQITSIPAIILFAGGDPVARVVGARSKARLEDALGLSRRSRAGGGDTGRGLRASGQRILAWLLRARP